jgi:hypothetical protein
MAAQGARPERPELIGEQQEATPSNQQRRIVSGRIVTIRSYRLGSYARARELPSLESGDAAPMYFEMVSASGG